jgi:hypothetical protein
VCEQLEATEELADSTVTHTYDLTKLQQLCLELQEKSDNLESEKAQLEMLNEALNSRLRNLQLLIGEGLPVEEAESAHKDMAQASPTSIIEDATLSSGVPSPAVDRMTRSNQQQSPIPRRGPAAGNRSPFTGQRGPHSDSNRVDSPGGSDRHRKPPVPTRDELRSSAANVRRSYPSISPKHSPMRRASAPGAGTGNSGTAVTGDSSASPTPQASATTSGSASPTKSPRVSLRSRIENQSRENNPWLGAFSTTNRSVKGGCQFYVDVPCSGSPGKRFTGYEDYDLTLSRGTSGGSEAHAPENDTESAGGVKVSLLKVDSTDLLNLSACSREEAEPSAIAAAGTGPGVADMGASADAAEDRDAVESGPVPMTLPAEVSRLPSSDHAPSVEQQLASYQAQIAALQSQLAALRRGHAAMPHEKGAGVTFVDAASPVYTGSWSADANDYDGWMASSVDSERNAPLCRTQSLEAPSLADVPPLSLEDSIRCDEGLILSPLSSAPKSCKTVTFSVYSMEDEFEGPTEELDAHRAAHARKAVRHSAAAAEDEWEEPVEFCDAEVQCEVPDSPPAPVAPLLAEASCNTDSAWLEEVVAASAVAQQDAAAAAHAVERRAEADAALTNAMEDTKFALGKRLFELRYGGKKAAAVPPPTPLGGKRAAGAPRVTPAAGFGAAVNKTAAAAVSSRAVPTPSVSAANGDPALPNASAFSSTAVANLNAALVTRLRQQTVLTARGRKKIELLEQKLVRLIMYVKRTSRETLDGERAAALASNMAVPPPATGAVSPTKASVAQRQQTPAGTNVKFALNASMNVGCMTGGADLDQLLNLGGNDDESPSPAVRSPQRSPVRRSPQKQPPRDASRTLFSPATDFQGRNYDDLSEINVSVQSNPLLHTRGVVAQPVTPGADRSKLDLSFNADRSFLDTPEMESPAGMQAQRPNGDGVYSPIPMASTSASSGPAGRSALVDRTRSVAQQINGLAPQQPLQRAPPPPPHPHMQENPQMQQPARPATSVAAAIGGARPVPLNRSSVRPITAVLVKPKLEPVAQTVQGAQSPTRSPVRSPLSPKRELFPPGAAAGGMQSAVVQDGGAMASAGLEQAEVDIRRLQQQVGHLTLRNKVRHVVAATERSARYDDCAVPHLVCVTQFATSYRR